MNDNDNRHVESEEMTVHHRHVQIGTATMYRVIDTATGEVVFETLDPLEAEEIAQRQPPQDNDTEPLF